MFASILGVYYPCNNFLYAEHILQCNDQTMGFYAYIRIFCIYQERFNYLIKNEYKDVIKKTSCDKCI